MATATKHRMCRRFGAPLCGRPNCPAPRRPYPRGMHGRRRQRVSPYRLCLLEKQKARALYDVGERQLRRLFDEATRQPGQSGQSGHNLLVLLEQRLDNLLYRLGFALSIQQARQLVSHGHVRVLRREKAGTLL